MVQHYLMHMEAAGGRRLLRQYIMPTRWRGASYLTVPSSLRDDGPAPARRLGHGRARALTPHPVVKHGK